MGAGLAMLISNETGLQSGEGQAGLAMVIGFSVLWIVALAFGLPAALADRAWVEGIPLE